MRRIFNDDDDRDDPLPSDQDIGNADDDYLDQMPCPYCKVTISERNEVCPHCGSFISRDDLPSTKRPAWLTFVILLLLISFMFGVVSLR